MLLVEVLRWLHVMGATVLLGTGAGIAFFLVMACRTRDPRLVAHVASTVVIADGLFTATAAIAQPITGVALAHQIGWPLTQGWIVASVCLYILTGAFWLPVVRIQMRLRELASAAAKTGNPLPPEFDRLYRIWFACGIPAFSAMLATFWLMLMKPSFDLL